MAFLPLVGMARGEHPCGHLHHPRTDPANFLGLQFAEAIVERTVGGRVTADVMRDLAYIGYLVETKAPEGPYFGAATVRADVERVLNDPSISPRITVSGHAYDVESGLVRTAVEATAPTPAAAAQV
jgi:carbonic anhydrase